jgi:hypothetical protein
VTLCPSQLSSSLAYCNRPYTRYDDGWTDLCIRRCSLVIKLVARVPIERYYTIGVVAARGRARQRNARRRRTTPRHCTHTLLPLQIKASYYSYDLQRERDVRVHVCVSASCIGEHTTRKGQHAHHSTAPAPAGVHAWRRANTKAAAAGARARGRRRVPRGSTPQLVWLAGHPALSSPPAGRRSLASSVRGMCTRFVVVRRRAQHYTAAQYVRAYTDK